MAKASSAGRAKTRLVPPLTYREAAAFNTAFLQDIVDNLRLAARRASIVGYMAFGPPGSEQFFRDHLPDVGLIEAWFPNFGNCLHRAVQEVLARGHESAVVLNSDSPTLPTSLLVETAHVLALPGDRVVLGPATDGGYYLLGLKQAHARMFEDIAWSTSRVAEETLARARELGLDVHVLAPWYDVDDIEALRTLHAGLEHVAQKREPVLRRRTCSNKEIERDDDWKKSHPAPGASRSFDRALSPYPASRSAELIALLLRTTDLAQRLGIVPALEGAAL